MAVYHFRRRVFPEKRQTVGKRSFINTSGPVTPVEFLKIGIVSGKLAFGSPTQLQSGKICIHQVIALNLLGAKGELHQENQNEHPEADDTRADDYGARTRLKDNEPDRRDDAVNGQPRSRQQEDQNRLR